MPTQRLPYIPDLLKLHSAFPQRFPSLLESSLRHQDTGRYDILLALPGEALVLQNNQCHGPGSDQNTKFLDALDAWFKRETCAPEWGDELSPFCGGWLVYLGYELAGQIEPQLRLPASRDPLPTALALRCRGAIIIDRQVGQAYAVAETRDELAGLVEAAGAALPPQNPQSITLASCSEDDAADYLSAVTRTIAYIREGDVFQVNLSRAWQGQFESPIAPATLYARLRQANPGPFSGALHWQGQSVLSTSPERLLKLEGGRAQTRPIAGTRPRFRDHQQDTASSAELIIHPKERAEHVMLLDLERNDLGRICRPGTVRVDEMMVIESYTHVHHIVSNVCGELRPEVTPGKAIAAVFPGGTITGCPKVRCMEIIAELEGEGRGFYTGALGYLGRDGRMDLNILIRTLWTDGSQWRLRTGGGIVADSVPERELAETRAKAKGLLLGLGAPIDGELWNH